MESTFRWVVLISSLVVLTGLYLLSSTVHTYEHIDVAFSSRPENACSVAIDPFAEMLATRLEQYRRFWRDHPDFNITPSKHHSFYATKELTIKNLGHDPGAEVASFKHQVQKRERDGFIVLKVQEYFNGALSKGGSSFHSVVKSADMLHMCGYQDFFNGTYSIQCAMYAQCGYVKVNLVHVNFKQHQGVDKRQDVEVFAGEVCLHDACYHPKKPAERWQQQDSGNRSVWHAEHDDYPLPAEQFCRLVDRMVRDRFYMVGSSHMQHQHWYTMVKCSRYIGDLHKRLHYIPARYGADVISDIEKFTSKNRKTQLCKFSKPDKPYNCKQFKPKPGDKKHLKGLGVFKGETPCSYDSKLKTGMLFQIGSWDLSYHGLKKPLDNLIPNLDKTLQQLSRFQKANPSVNIAAMSPPPFYAYRYAETRNNDMIQLFDGALKEVAGKHDVKYIGNFHMMYPAYDRTPPKDSHYVHCKGTKCLHDDVGVVAIQRAVQALATPCD